MCCEYVNIWSAKLIFDDQLFIPKQSDFIRLSLIFDSFVLNQLSGGYKINKSRLFNILYLTRTDF